MYVVHTGDIYIIYVYYVSNVLNDHIIMHEPCTVLMNIIKNHIRHEKWVGLSVYTLCSYWYVL